MSWNAAWPTITGVAAGDSASTRKRDPRYYPGLDALRGIAAVVVVFYHVFLPIGIVLVPAGYLAVDFFFMLSGFVVANAYGEKLGHDLTFRRFTAIRIARLYPLFALGMAMGIAVSAVKATVVIGLTDYRQFLLSALMGLFMVPFGHLPYSNATSVYPFDGPAWSLFFEIAVNLVYAAAFVRLRQTSLAVLILLCGVWLLYACMMNGSMDVGGTTATFVGGIPRVTFSFFAGILIFRDVASRKGPDGPFTTLACMAVLLLILIYPQRANPQVSDSFVVFLAFPAILALTALNNNVGGFTRLAKFSGALSYPLYITHYPVMRVFQFVCEHYHFAGIRLVLVLATEIITIFVVSYCALSFFDVPIQRRLRRYLDLGYSARASARLSPAAIGARARETKSSRSQAQSHDGDPDATIDSKP